MSDDKSVPKRGFNDKGSSTEIALWIETILGEQIPKADLIETLKDGVILCRVADKVQPGSVKYKKSSMPFVQMENIAAFLRAASKIGVPDDELFETVDLFESQDPVQVFTTIRSYSRYANKKLPDSVPLLGPKLAQKQTARRDFKPVDIPAWNTHQYGFMGGANQSTEGVVVGKRREITQPETQQPKPAPKPHNILVPSRPAKPSSLSSIKKVPAKPNIFSSAAGSSSEESDSGENKGKQKKVKKMHHDASKRLMAYSVQSQLQVKKLEADAHADDDASIYAYDEVYDSMKASVRDTKKKEEPTTEPRYMDKLLESKKQRERDRQRAMDVKLRRERENEPEELKGKESFVTAAYKKQQEEIEKALEEEENEKNTQKSGMSTFYKSYLDTRESSHTVAVQGSLHNNNDTAAKEEEGDALEPQAPLAAGLNIVKSNSLRSEDRETRHKRDYSDHSSIPNSRNRGRNQGHDRNKETRDFERIIEERARKEKQEQEAKRQKVLSLYKTGSSDSSLSKIEAAKQRLLARKQQK